MNRIAHGPKWKPESAARMLWDLGRCVRMCTSFVCFCRIAEHGAVTGVTNGCQMGDKLRAADEEGKGVSSSCWNFFSSAFSNLLVDWYSSCWNVSSCCVVYTCAVEKTRRKKCACRERHLDTKAKSNEKNNSCRSNKKMLSKQTPNPLKYRSRRDAPSGVTGRATTEMSTILGERPAPAAEGEWQVFLSPSSVLISPC